MTDQNRITKAGPKQRQKADRRSYTLAGLAWLAEAADRFLFKGQCYDAGPDSETKCGLCGKHIRFCYVLKVLELSDPLTPEVGKAVIGECCFEPIKAANAKLYRQLLAAAINLRTFMEAVQRDKRRFSGPGLAQDEIECSPSGVVGAEEPLNRLFDSLIEEGGDHA